jgi:hypothetical protein
MIEIITFNQNKCTSQSRLIVNLTAIDDLKHYY